jgi:hypothetical protein
MNRQSLLRSAFCEVPQTVSGLDLRPCSPGSFALLGELKNPLIAQRESSAAITMDELFGAVIQYIWIHTAPLDQVLTIVKSEDLPELEIKKLGFALRIEDALEFTTSFSTAAEKMAAALAETDDDDEPGKPTAAQPPTGSPLSSLPSVLPVTPSASDTFSGSPPSPAPSPTSTPPLPPTDHAPAGVIPLMILPEMPPQTPPE